jgi:linoleoyl-CoA desaturase
LLHPWWCVLTVYLLGAALSGLLLATVLQWAHCVEGARFTSAPPGDARLPATWLEVQVEATRNVRLPRWLSWYVGGLDHQIEHHLFPRYPHTVYRRLAPSIEQFCRSNQLDYRTHPNVGRALRAHFRWLREMGVRRSVAAPTC